MSAAIDRFNAEHLAAVSPARRAAHLAILSGLQDWLAPERIVTPEADAIARFLADRVGAGYSPGTVRKWRAMILAFYGWAWREGYISGDTLLELRAIRPPSGFPRRAQPNPYRASELRELRRVLDERWPRLQPEGAQRWITRWRDGRSRYSRICSHAIRLQLDAIIALALHCGLRRDEIFRLDVEAIHPDNAYLGEESHFKRGSEIQGAHRVRRHPTHIAASVLPVRNGLA